MLSNSFVLIFLCICPTLISDIQNIQIIHLCIPRNQIRDFSVAGLRHRNNLKPIYCIYCKEELAIVCSLRNNTLGF